ELVLGGGSGRGRLCRRSGGGSRISCRSGINCRRWRSGFGGGGAWRRRRRVVGRRRGSRNLRLVRLGRQDVPLATVAQQLLGLQIAELDFKALVGHHAPLVRLLGVGKAVDILAAGAPIAGRGELQRAFAAL